LKCIESTNFLFIYPIIRNHISSYHIVTYHIISYRNIVLLYHIIPYIFYYIAFVQCNFPYWQNNNKVLIEPTWKGTQSARETGGRNYIIRPTPEGDVPGPPLIRQHAIIECISKCRVPPKASTHL